MLKSFLFTYFNLPVMAEYLPMIVEGFILTVELAAAMDKLVGTGSTDDATNM